MVHAIKSISEMSAEVPCAHWYVNTTISAKQVCEWLKSVLGESDKLIVVDTTNNQVAWLNLSGDAVKRLHAQGF